MGFFDKEFWLGKGPGQSTMDLQAYDPNQQSFEQSQAGGVLEGQMQSRAAGMGPSAAQNQLNYGLGRVNQAATAQARSMAGVNPATALRLQQQTMADNASDVNQQAAILRAQEQTQAQGMLGQWLQQRQAALMDLERLRAQQQQATQGMQLQQDLYNQQAQQSTGFAGALLGAAGAGLGAYLGGPEGAKAGGAAGSAFGSSFRG